MPGTVGNDGRLSASSCFDFSSRQTTGSRGSYGLAYSVRMSSMRSLNSGVSFGMHHIFFPPGFHVLTLQHEPYRLRADGGHDPVLHRLFGEELHRPACASFRCIGTCQRYDLRFMLSGEGRRLAGAGSIVEGTGKTMPCKTGTDINDGSVRRPSLLCDFLVRVSAVRLEENLRTTNDTCRVKSFACEFIELPLLFRGKMNGEILHGEQSLTCTSILEAIQDQSHHPPLIFFNPRVLLRIEVLPGLVATAPHLPQQFRSHFGRRV